MSEMQEREPWEIVWHVRLQNIFSYYRMEDMACKAIGIKRVEAINRAISRANALIAKHGAPGTAALDAAAGSLGALADMECAGIARIQIAPTVKAEHCQSSTGARD